MKVTALTLRGSQPEQCKRVSVVSVLPVAVGQGCVLTCIVGVGPTATMHFPRAFLDWSWLDGSSDETICSIEWAWVSLVTFHHQALINPWKVKTHLQWASRGLCVIHCLDITNNRRKTVKLVCHLQGPGSQSFLLLPMLIAINCVNWGEKKNLPSKLNFKG